MQRQTIDHGFGPFYRKDSKILILGSFPSVKSREQAFFYGHPQNRFWKVLAAVFEDEVPTSIPEKKLFLERHRIALYDVIERCSIIGSSDSTIRDVVPADLKRIVMESGIDDRIYTNGKKAFELYCKYQEPELGKRAVSLPSTSPANAAMSLKDLEVIWKKAILQPGVTVQELERFDKKETILIDVRNETSYAYGHIPGAVSLPMDQLAAGSLPPGKRFILYDKRGTGSREAAERLRESGVWAYYLEEGYIRWLMEHEAGRETGEDFCREVEEGIRKRFKKKIWSRFTKAINQYELVKEGDRIAVCISGGKDSMLMAKLFQELKRHNKFDFELEFLVMDPGYSPENRQLIEANAKRLQIPIKIFRSEIFDSVYTIEKNPCYLCARMRRGHLYHQAKELGCNKIALGHHYDDVIETILMGMLYGAQMQSMMPKLHSTNFPSMELIRPMYLIREEDIKNWRDANDLYFLQCACRFTEESLSGGEDEESRSKRFETKKLIARLKKTNPFVEGNIFKSAENVMVDTLIAYKKDGIRHHFLDDYDEKTGDIR